MNSDVGNRDDDIRKGTEIDLISYDDLITYITVINLILLLHPLLLFSGRKLSWPLLCILYLCNQNIASMLSHNNVKALVGTICASRKVATFGQMVNKTKFKKPEGELANALEFMVKAEKVFIKKLKNNPDIIFHLRRNPWIFFFSSL